MPIAPPVMDLWLFVAFVVIVVAFSLWKSRSAAGGGSAGFFLAGRGLRWPVIGISIVAANISSEQMVGMSGAGAGGVGLAVSAWQLAGALFIVLISFTLLPRFLRAGIYTMPEFLEYRYNALARGIMAAQLYDLGGSNDAAYPTLIRELAGPGVRGFLFAAIAGAVVSSLASMLNSASTVATIDVYQRLIVRDTSEPQLVWLGRVLTVVFVVAGCLIAPLLTDGVFQFIQQFQGFIWPGVVAAFLGAFLLPRAPAAAGVAALALGPPFYALAQLLTKQGLFAGILARPVFEMHFLMQVLCCFATLFVVMAFITMLRPLPQPRVLPVRAEMDVRTEPVVYAAGAVVIAGVIAFFIVFW